jgi:ElaB/YqjD/DUF883 family membrane-anchored ribosome-binding protein
MKKVLIGAAVGLAVGAVVYKLYREGKLDGFCDDMGRLADKTKRNLKNAVDVGKNQAEYIKDRVEHEFQAGKERLSKGSE